MDSDGRSGRTAGTEAVRREELDVLAPNTDGQQEGDETGERGYHVTREKAGRPLLTSPITAEPLSHREHPRPKRAVRPVLSGYFFSPLFLESRGGYKSDVSRT